MYYTLSSGNQSKRIIYIYNMQKPYIIDSYIFASKIYTFYSED